MRLLGGSGVLGCFITVVGPGMPASSIAELSAPDPMPVRSVGQGSSGPQAGTGRLPSPCLLSPQQPLP